MEIGLEDHMITTEDRMESALTQNLPPEGQGTGGSSIDHAVAGFKFFSFFRYSSPVDSKT